MRPVVVFLALTFGISWGLAAIAFDARVGASERVREGASLAAKFGPSLAGVLAAAWYGGGAGVRALLHGLAIWRAPAHLWLAAWALPLLLWSLAGALQALSRDLVREADWSRAAAFAPLFLRHYFVGGALGEELGWRGFMLPQLQRRHGALAASLWIGLAWGLWHAPPFFYDTAGKTGGWPNLALFTLLTTAYAVLFSWLWNASRGSLLLVTVLHASLSATENTFEQVFPAVDGDSATTIGYGLLVLGLAIALVVACGPRLLTRRAAGPPAPQALGARDAL